MIRNPCGAGQGLPVFGFLGFSGAVAGGLWLVRAIWRSSRPGDDDDMG